MSEFGEALRKLRERHGLTQQALADALREGGRDRIARSTIANLETGRQQPSPRLWQLLIEYFPDDVEILRPIYEQARDEQEAAAAAREPQRRSKQQKVELPADYLIERYDIVYVFRDSRSPEEIIELWRVRARSSGAHDYGVNFGWASEGFDVETEVLFGGEIAGCSVEELPGKTLLLNLIDFGRTLRKGERHSFGVRYLVQRDPGDHDGGFVPVFTDYDMDEVGVHVNFWGMTKPSVCWAFEGLPDQAMAPGKPEDGVIVGANKHSMVGVEFRGPVTGTWFGVGWRW